MTNQNVTTTVRDQQHATIKKLEELELITRAKFRVRRKSLIRTEIVKLASIPLLLGAIGVLVINLLSHSSQIDVSALLMNFVSEMLGASVTLVLFEVIWRSREDQLELRLDEDLKREALQFELMKSLAALQEDIIARYESAEGIANQ